jgi:hypothetical protein
LTPGDYGFGDLVNLSSSEDKNSIGRRLLKALEKRVERRHAQHVNFVDDVHLKAISRRRERFE